MASPLCPVSILIREDLPTLDRPMNAYSGRFVVGQSSTEGLLFTKVAECINIGICFFLIRKDGCAERIAPAADL